VIPALDHELWLLERLREKGVEVDPFDGTTDVPERAARMRQAILDRDLTCVVAGSKERKPITYAQAFERLYGEKL
jgi:hypothetical protein